MRSIRACAILALIQVTVAGATCVEAGMLATFAMLRGPDAETFLKGQDVRYWCLR